MNVNKTTIKACQVLRHRCRLSDPRLKFTLARTHNDTHAIRQAVAFYIETQITPLIDAIEGGELAQMRKLTAGQKTDPIPSEYTVTGAITRIDEALKGGGK